MLLAITFILVVLFVLSNIYSEEVNYPKMNPLTNALSNYLTTPEKYSGLVQSAGYVLMSVAMLLLIINGVPNGHSHGINLDLLWYVPLAVTGISILGVVATAWLNKSGANDMLQHRIFAGLAFLGLLVAEAYYFWGTKQIWVVAVAVSSTILFARFAPNMPTKEEKNLTLWLIVGALMITAPAVYML